MIIRLLGEFRGDLDAYGSTVADISSTLYLSESTVRNYLSSAIHKTGTRNRIDAAQTARHNGWL
jgi:two-component system response regulator DesR